MGRLKLAPMPQRSPQSILVLALVGSGVLTIVVSIVLALTVDPILVLIGVVGIIDFGLAWAYASGKLGAPRPQVAHDLAPGGASQDPPTTLTRGKTEAATSGPGNGSRAGALFRFSLVVRDLSHPRATRDSRRSRVDPWIDPYDESG